MLVCVIESRLRKYRNYDVNDAYCLRPTPKLRLLELGSLPAALRAAQTCRYFVYSEADFEIFRPAGATRCTDGGEIWHGGGDRQISPPSVQRVAPAGRKISKSASE